MTTRRHHHLNQINQTAAKHQTVKPAYQKPARLLQPADAALLQRAMDNSGALSPPDVLRLQRMVGNRAMGPLVAQSPSPTPGQARPLIQAKLTVNPPGDQYEQEADQAAEQVMEKIPGPGQIQRLAFEHTNWGDATEAKFSKTGGTGVTFVKDNTEDSLVVKGAKDPIGETTFLPLLHSKVAGTVPVATRVATGEKDEIINVLNNKGTWEETAKARGIEPEELKDMVIGAFQKAPNIFVMGKAPGRDFKDLAKEPGDNVKTLLENENYLRKLGMTHAVDLFVGNGDRLDVGNLGNWMTEANGIIAVIDNFDAHGSSQWLGRDLGDKTLIKKLAPSKLQATAQEVVNTLIRMLKYDAPDRGWDEWFTGQREQFLVTNIKEGLKSGRSKLLSKLAPMIGRRSRTLKGEVVGREGGLGQQGWEKIKERARYLKRLR